MQVCPPKRARFLQIAVGGLLLAGVVVGGSGCTDRVRSPNVYSPFGTIDTIATTAPRDSALALLTAMKRVAFDSAFARLDEYAVTRHVRTEQLDTTGATTGFRTLTLRYAPGVEAGTIQRADSAGSFQKGGLLSGITPGQRRAATPPNLAAQALPDQPAYLAPRTREAYRYALRPDTLLDGTPAYVIEAKARSGQRGGEQGVRYARLTVDRISLELVGLTVARASRILLFRENSLVTVRLRRDPAGGRDFPGGSDSRHTWVPHLTRFRAVVDVPFRAARQIRTVSTYYGYAHP